MNNNLEIELSEKKSYWKASISMTKASTQGAEGGSLSFLQELPRLEGELLRKVLQNKNTRI